MIIIADAGSTKVEWAVVNDRGTATTFETCGVNAMIHSAEAIGRSFAPAFEQFAAAGEIDAIYYYGAGCATAEVCEKVASVLPRAATVEVASDMLGAARALFGRREGLALILGTGSNSALYDGRNLTANMPPLGYLIGDEGSGASLGRRLLREVYRGGGSLRQRFERWQGRDYGAMLAEIYGKPGANRLMAGFVPFIAENVDELAHLVIAEFDSLFEQLARYYGPGQKVSAIGGVACAFEAQLRQVAAARGFELAEVKSRPISGLIAYHSQK